MPNPDMEMKMSASSSFTIFSSTPVAEISEKMNATRSRLIRQGSLVLAATLALAAACTGGAGLDVPVQTVDHGCHTGQGVPMGGEGSGCS
jgi:hypothetical protein